MDLLEEVRKDSALTACIVLARNSIVGNNNKNFTSVMQNAIDKKEKVFDKVIVRMVDNCVNSIEDKHVEEILTSEQVNLLDHPYQKYLSFNKDDIELKEITFDKRELELLSIIYVELILMFRTIQMISNE